MRSGRIQLLHNGAAVGSAEISFDVTVGQLVDIAAKVAEIAWRRHVVGHKGRGHIALVEFEDGGSGIATSIPSVVRVGSDLPAGKDPVVSVVHQADAKHSGGVGREVVQSHAAHKTSLSGRWPPPA